jgi:hypothetical protein
LKSKEKQSWKEKPLKGRGINKYDEKARTEKINCTEIIGLRNLGTFYVR